MDYPDLVNDRAKADTFGAGKNGFTEGTGDPLTRSLLRSVFGNAWTREILATVENAGLTPDADDLTQLSKATVLPFLLSCIASMRRIQPGANTLNYRVTSSFGQKLVAAGNTGAGAGTIVTSVDGGTTLVGAAASAATDFTRAAAGPISYVVSSGLAGTYEWGTIGSSSVPTTGTIAGAPTISHLFYDAVNSLYWAVTSSGIWKTSNLTAWTQVTATTGFTHICVQRSGRVVAYRSTNDSLYYSDSPHTSFTAGAVVGIVAAGGSACSGLAAGSGGIVVLGDDGGGNTDMYFSLDATSITNTELDYNLTFSTNQILSIGEYLVVPGLSAVQVLLDPANSFSAASCSLPYNLSAAAVTNGHDNGMLTAASTIADEFIYVSAFYPKITWT